MQRLPQRYRADLLAICHSTGPRSSWRTCLESMPFLSAVETLWIRFIPTDHSLYTENPNTDDRQDDDGIVSVSFGLDGSDMELSVVYWV